RRRKSTKFSPLLARLARLQRRSEQHQQEVCMSTAYDPYAQNAPQDPLKNPPPRKSSTGRNCLIGCLVLLLLMILVCGGIGLAFYFYGGSWLVETGRTVIDQAVRDSGMPEEERREVM